MSWTALFLLASALVADAHIAMWHEAMFGLNTPNPASGPQDYNANQQIKPLRGFDNLDTDQWFAHGYKHLPPMDGVFLELPAGGNLVAELACNRAFTTLRDPRIADRPMQYYACESIGAMHVMNKLNEAPDVSKFGGTSLAIAYTSDVDALKPTDMTVISVNYTSVWTRETVYPIPADLGACPEAGCLCTWNWIHQAMHGEGYGAEIYNIMFRCKVTGATTGNTLAVGGATVPALCAEGEEGAGECTVGPKQPMYAYQKSGNNMPEDLHDPPSYNKRFGFADGAQNDLFLNGSTPAPSSSASSAASSAASSSASSASAGDPAPSGSASDAATAASSTATQLGINAIATGAFSASSASASSTGASSAVPSASAPGTRVCKRHKVKRVSKKRRAVF